MERVGVADKRAKWQSHGKYEACQASNWDTFPQRWWWTWSWLAQVLLDCFQDYYQDCWGKWQPKRQDNSTVSDCWLQQLFSIRFAATGASWESAKCVSVCVLDPDPPSPTSTPPISCRILSFWVASIIIIVINIVIFIILVGCRNVVGQSWWFGFGFSLRVKGVCIPGLDCIYREYPLPFASSKYLSAIDFILQSDSFKVLIEKLFVLKKDNGIGIYHSELFEIYNLYYEISCQL